MSKRCAIGLVNAQWRLCQKLVLASGCRGLGTTRSILMNGKLLPLRGMRSFHLSTIQHNEARKIETRIFTFQSPIKYISLKIKTFLMRAYFDPEFDEKIFLSGAKQGVVFVSSHLSEGKFSELLDVLTPEGMQAGRELYFQHDKQPASLRVDESDFLQTTLSDIDFEYGDEGRKWAYVLVTCFCTTKEAVTKTFGNIDVIATPTRILKYSFRREYTPGVAVGWLVDRVEHSKTAL